MFWRKLRTRSLEINTTTHCNLRCFGCGRVSPAYSDEFSSVDSLRKDLAVLSPILHVQSLARAEKKRRTRKGSVGFV